MLESEVRDIRRDQEAASTAHVLLSDKIDKLANKLLVATCLITGVVIGSRVINIDHIEKLRNLFFP